MSGFVPLNAGYTVSVRRTRLNILVQLILALAGESPPCILHEGIHPVAPVVYQVILELGIGLFREFESPQ